MQTKVVWHVMQEMCTSNAFSEIDVFRLTEMYEAEARFSNLDQLKSGCLHVHSSL